MATSSHEVDVTSILEAMAIEIKTLRSRVGTLENTEIIPGKVKDPSGATTYGLTSGSTGNVLSGDLVMAEMTAPGAPAANGVAIYAVDNGGGKTQLMVLFATGAAQQLAIQA